MNPVIAIAGLLAAAWWLNRQPTTVEANAQLVGLGSLQILALAQQGDTVIWQGKQYVVRSIHAADARLCLGRTLPDGWTDAVCVTRQGRLVRTQRIPPDVGIRCC